MVCVAIERLLAERMGRSRERGGAQGRAAGPSPGRSPRHSHEPQARALHRRTRGPARQTPSWRTTAAGSPDRGGRRERRATPPTLAPHDLLMSTRPFDRRHAFAQAVAAVQRRDQQLYATAMSPDLDLLR